MGRGHGQVQQRVLDRLKAFAEKHGPAYLPVRSLAQREGDDTAWSSTSAVSGSALESTHRAVRTLAAKGLVEARTMRHGNVVIKGVRLADKRFRLDVPAAVQEAFDEHLEEVLLRTMNEWLREMGLRQRVRAEERPEEERVLLHVPGSGSSHVAVYSHPAEPTDPEEWRRLLVSFTQGVDTQFGPRKTSPAKPNKGNAGEVGPLDRAFARTVAASLGHLMAMRLEQVAEVAFRLRTSDSDGSSS